MPDITMCLGTNCPHKESCYRYTATPNEYRQSYFTEPPIKEGNCEMYWGQNQINIWNQLKEVVEISTPTPPIKSVERMRIGSNADGSYFIIIK